MTKIKGIGRLSRWAYPRIDWEARIKNGPITITETDLKIMNDTELVEVIRLLGYRVDRGYGSARLQGVLRQIGKGVAPGTGTLIDQIRDRMIGFYARNKSQIWDQLAEHCNFECYEHPDIVVLSCFLINRETIEEEEKSVK